MKSTDETLIVDRKGRVRLPDTSPGDILIYDKTTGQIRRGEAIIGTTVDISNVYQSGYDRNVTEAVLRTTQLFTGE